jgi:hypothetical protein
MALFAYYTIFIITNINLLHGGDEKKKVKLSRYTPWRHMGGEEV